MSNQVSRRTVLKSAARLALAAPIVGLPACNANAMAKETVRLAGATMGTTYGVLLSDPPADAEVKALRIEIDRILETVNEEMSTWRARSELSRFNASRSTDWFAVSAETVGVVERALEVSRLSGGAFDITVGPLVNHWGFGSPIWRETTGAPSPEQLLARIGHDKITTRASPPALAKGHPESFVDLSGIAKGFGLDRVAERLGRAGVANYLIEIGGELRARGSNPRGVPWRIGIEKPSAGGAPVHGVVRLGDGAIATSGDYRNVHEADGQRRSHIIDPRTARPIGDALASVSVIARSTIHADALATALIVLGPEHGMRLAMEHRISALFLVRRGGRTEEISTPGFDRHRIA